VNSGKTIFAQLMEFIPAYRFRQCFENYRIVKKRLDLDMSLYTIPQFLSVTLFEKVDILQAITFYDYKTEDNSFLIHVQASWTCHLSSTYCYVGFFSWAADVTCRQLPSYTNSQKAANLKNQCSHNIGKCRQSSQLEHCPFP